MAEERVAEIDGYTNSVNQTGENTALRADRSQAVHDFLLSNGAVDLLVGQGVGAPDGGYVGDNSSAAGRAANRAVLVKMGPFPIPTTPNPDTETNQSYVDPSQQRSVNPNPPQEDQGPNRSADPTLALEIKSKEWSISSVLSGSAGVFGLMLLQITNKATGFSYPVTFTGLGALTGGLTLSNPGWTDFTTDVPVLVEEFNDAVATIKFAEAAIVGGGGLAYLGFTFISTSPSQLDIGGWELGLSVGFGGFVGETEVGIFLGVPPPGASSSP